MEIEESTLANIAQDLLDLNEGQAVIWGNKAWIVEDISDAIVPIHKDQVETFDAGVVTYIISRSPSMTSLGPLKSQLAGIEGIFVEELNDQYFKCANLRWLKNYIVTNI